MTLFALCMFLQTYLNPVSPQVSDFPWPHHSEHESLARRFPTPAGFKRLEQAEDSMGPWLRSLPLLPRQSQVYLHSGQLKGNQSAHVAIVDIDVGKRDLQQCADAAMRLRAEFLWNRDRAADIRFNFTSGHEASWQAWQRGMRPRIQGSKVSWQARAQPNDTYKNFRRYLDTVFIYAGSASLEKELAAVRKPARILPGDVFIQGGFPGHAVMVMDVAENAAGERVFLLAQSYMPAQQIHILKQPGERSPWYPAKDAGALITPEWRFEYTDLYRFSD